MFEDLLQPRHLLVILLVAVLLFGPKKLPELGKGLAQGIRNFKDAFKASPDNAAGKDDSSAGRQA
jgi:sec-independent protein translocase protein TatA